MFSEILAAVAREVGAGPDNLVVLVLDGAGWHVAKDLVVRKRRREGTLRVLKMASGSEVPFLRDFRHGSFAR
jgi:hypothetical protein